ncbi:anti-sigma factor antagonist [Natronospirillum operosum]|uniref:Anti-sigma factor antagonist n=1 Tax=Natronospirillum operosum TaxID=2759953 RepID=A0A4Z0WB94_9GAMM|nr:STAS domain-containing protein [Natronospirillum operosum]TGG95949.1 anti-sigma factor antagonist [Natronospirillum operosum]
MKQGQILDAETDTTYVLRLVGDVRLTLSTTLERCIQKVLAARNYQQVVVDLTDTDGIDSTSLGMLAKLSIHVQETMGFVPLLVYGSEDIHRVLESMGFEGSVYLMLKEDSMTGTSTQAVEALDSNEEEIRERVLEAHRVLMSLNDTNAAAFRDLVCALEQGGC